MLTYFYFVVNILCFLYRHEDLKQMLDSNKDSLKLEAMKRIIGVSSILEFLLFEIMIGLTGKC
jgi:hypothetical protein